MNTEAGQYLSSLSNKVGHSAVGRAVRVAFLQEHDEEGKEGDRLAEVHDGDARAWRKEARTKAAHRLAMPLFELIWPKLNAKVACITLPSA